MLKLVPFVESGSSGFLGSKTDKKRLWDGGGLWTIIRSYQSPTPVTRPSNSKAGSLTPYGYVINYLDHPGPKSKPVVPPKEPFDHDALPGEKGPIDWQHLIDNAKNFVQPSARPDPFDHTPLSGEKGPSDSSGELSNSNKYPYPYQPVVTTRDNLHFDDTPHPLSSLKQYATTEFWKLFPTHGNYGGPNWSAGQWGGDPLAPDAPLAQGKFDEAYKVHDQMYAVATDAVDVQIADAVLQENLWHEFKDLSNLVSNPKGYTYSLAASTAFHLKHFLHDLGVEVSTK